MLEIFDGFFDPEETTEVDARIITIPIERYYHSSQNINTLIISKNAHRNRFVRRSWSLVPSTIDNRNEVTRATTTSSPLERWIWLDSSIITMENIQSWSSLEQHRRRHSPERRESTNETHSSHGFDALYVSPSSENIAPSAASLLRQAGLSGGDNDEEFRLRFHWMRPHPSLAFQIEDELMQQEKVDEAQGEAAEKMKQDEANQYSTSDTVHPAVEASRLMKAYMYAQSSKASSNKRDKDSSDETEKETEQRKASDETDRVDLPIEMPKLRINLASLIEAPLMSSWLPWDNLDETSD